MQFVPFAKFRRRVPEVIYEVMTQGLPIITTNVGGIPYLLKHRENALIVEPCSAEQISTAMEELISSISLREKFVNNNYVLIKDILNERAASQLYEMLKKMEKNLKKLFYK